MGERETKGGKSRLLAEHVSGAPKEKGTEETEEEGESAFFSFFPFLAELHQDFLARLLDEVMRSFISQPPIARDREPTFFPIPLQNYCKRIKKDLRSL